MEKASEWITCRGGTDSPLAQGKVRNLWELINPAGHTAFHVYYGRPWHLARMMAFKDCCFVKRTTSAYCL